MNKKDNTNIIGKKDKTKEKKLINNQYLQTTYDKIQNKNPEQIEFLQAVKEVLTTLTPVFNHNPLYEKYNIAERIIEPERFISFKITWVDDQGNIQVNRGYRVQFNSAIGPYKGGLRFHPSVNASIIKFLGFEQIFKNSLTGLAMGGGKGGSNFDPRDKSEGEIMRFCQAFMNELYRHIGFNTDVPAGDIGVGAREIGYLFGQYRKIANQFTGVLTGKALNIGGSLERTEATGYGLCYFTKEMLASKHQTFKNKKIIISGSGNVALYAAIKAQQLGGTIIAMSDSTGYIHDDMGLDLQKILEIKETNKQRIEQYLKYYPETTFSKKHQAIWQIPCHIALPCATQNELDLKSAISLTQNGCIAVAEGANMPTTPEAISYLQNNDILFAPAKAANAGGVATSGLEMAQNSMRLSWPIEEVDMRLHQIMSDIYQDVSKAAQKYGLAGDLVAGANIAGFIKVADAMISQGII